MAESSPGSPGALGRARKLLGRVRRRFVYDVYDVFVRPVPPPSEAVGGDPPGYRLLWGTPEDLARCTPFHTELDERERDEGAQRLALGHRLVLGRQGELAVFTMWVNPRNLNVPGLLKRRLAPEQWFIYKAFTSPEHRGKKLYEGGMRFVLAEMARAGKRELVGYAHVKKDVSRKGLAALAFGSVGRATLIANPFFRRVRLSRELVARFPEAVPRSGAVRARVRPEPVPQVNAP